MGEKIKDLIYDFSDIIISLIIITMIFGVVSWKISDSMAYSSFTPQSSKATLEQKEPPVNKTDDTTEVNVSKDNSASTVTPDTAAATPPPATVGGKPAASGNPTGSTTASSPTAPVSTAADVKITIPAGSAGISIAKILKQAGIITDTKVFITRVDQLKMGPKLKAGTFTIKAGSSLDDVIYLIAGKKK